MPEAYLVRVRSISNYDDVETLQVIADSADQAAAAVRKIVGPDAIVEAETEPISAERAVEASLIAGKPRLG